MYDRYYKKELQCDAFRFKYYKDTYDDNERDKTTDQMIRDGCKNWIGFSGSDDYKMQQKKVHDHNVLVFTMGVTSTLFRNDSNLFQMEGINDARKYERLLFYETNKNHFKYSHPYQILNFDSVRLILKSYLHIYSYKNIKETVKKIYQ